jgi:hypothetical protein
MLADGFNLGGLSLPWWLAPGVGVGFAVMTLALGGWLLARKKPPQAPAEPANGERDPFAHGSVSERRSAHRRGGSQVEVAICDPELKNPPIFGWVTDRSLGGLCLRVGSALEKGLVLAVRPTKAPPITPWTHVEVKTCVRDCDAYKLGCEFVRTPPYAVLLMFG